MDILLFAPNAETDPANAEGISISQVSAVEWVPVEWNDQLERFTNRLVGGEFDILISLHPLDTRVLLEHADQEHFGEEVDYSLRNATIVCVGPDTDTPFTHRGIDPDCRIPVQHTGPTLVRLLNQLVPYSGARIGVVGCRVEPKSLADALNETAADVSVANLFTQATRDSDDQLNAAINAVIEGSPNWVAFSDPAQVEHVFAALEDESKAAAFRDALRGCSVACLAPVTGAILHQYGVRADLEADPPRLDVLLDRIKVRGPDLIQRKSVLIESGFNPHETETHQTDWKSGSYDPVQDSPFLKAVRGEKGSHTPIWLMRQAGRYQARYREIRSGKTFLDMCFNPEIAAEVTMLPIDQFGMDAAILFADILLILDAIGGGLSFEAGYGPRIANPVRSSKDLDNLTDFDPDAVGYVYDAVKIVRKALRPDTPLIGFAGAPFTVASYLVEGGKSRDYRLTKGMMFSDPGAWNALMERMTDITAAYLNRQIEAGVNAVQIFDSWGGNLSPDAYRTFLLPHMKRLFELISDEVPRIHFLNQNPALLELAKEAGGDAFGIDWRMDIAEARTRLGADTPVQGNLDPAVLHTDIPTIKREAKKILDKIGGAPGHIFNLGHGILTNTPPDHVSALVDYVHEVTAS